MWGPHGLLWGLTHEDTWRSTPYYINGVFDLVLEYLFEFFLLFYLIVYELLRVRDIEVISIIALA